ncbi:hypothetical protein D3C85_1593410 [compost metagenome]
MPLGIHLDPKCSPVALVFQEHAHHLAPAGSDLRIALQAHTAGDLRGMRVRVLPARVGVGEFHFEVRRVPLTWDLADLIVKLAFDVLYLVQQPGERMHGVERADFIG